MAKGSLIWKKAAEGESMEGAIEAGSASDGTPLQIARARVGSELASGKLRVGDDHALVSIAGTEETCTEYEVLCNVGDVQLTWIACSGGEFASGAVEAGTCDQKQAIVIARCHHDGAMVPGKLVPRTGSAYFPFEGAEVSCGEYEVLCVKSVKPQKAD